MHTCGVRSLLVRSKHESISNLTQQLEMRCRSIRMNGRWKFGGLLDSRAEVITVSKSHSLTLVMLQLAMWACLTMNHGMQAHAVQCTAEVEIPGCTCIAGQPHLPSLETKVNI